MPQAASKKQFRYMMAILSKKPGSSQRGDRVPASIAEKYKDSSSSDLPEDKHKAHAGGHWTEAHHEKHTNKESNKKHKKSKSRLHKSLQDFLISHNRKGAGCLLVDNEGKILLGKRTDSGQWTAPGGHVDLGEDFEQAAVRELKEETGLTTKKYQELHHAFYGSCESKAFLVTSWEGELKSNGELVDLKWFYVSDIPWKELTTYTAEAILKLMEQKLNKSNNIERMLVEELTKNIIRSGDAPGNTVYELTHGDAMKIVGNGTFRFLRQAVNDMTDESIRDIPIDTHTLHIRKHVNDVYSGRITDGQKQIHQFTNKSLPAVAAELMSVFEWYSPEDESVLDMVDEEVLPDDAITNGMQHLVENYRRNNIVNIYNEMENIRQEVRNGVAIDLQQVEQRIMKLFDRLEDRILSIADKHNQLSNDAGDAVDILESKLRELQAKVEQLAHDASSVQAIAPRPESAPAVHAAFYPYLPRPEITVTADGSVKITFASGWTPMERENFLKDIKAKVIKRAGRA